MCHRKCNRESSSNSSLPAPPERFTYRFRVPFRFESNTTHGIAHLAAPPNSLTAEIELGADATVLRKNGRGLQIVEPDALICCAQYGGPDRNSDPTIGAAVNALASLGAYVTLRNPVGLYMDHIDLAGWAAPDKRAADEFVWVARGEAGMIERLVIEVPEGLGYVLGEVMIAGAPIRYGGQIAECITVKLTGVAGGLGSFRNTPAPCSGRCCMDTSLPTILDRPFDLRKPIPPGMRSVLVDEGEEDVTRHAAAAKRTLGRSFKSRSPL